jgi:photosystem II stability/assembly factor-like uncharacterized protein
MFFGREDMFSWIERSLTGKYSDHILVIHGQRRVGKTSVLKQLPNRLPDNYLPLFIDLQGRVNTTLGRFLWWFARLIANFVKEQTGKEIKLPERDAFKKNPDQFESSFIPEVTEALGEQRLLLTFDEFDSLENSGEQDSLALPLMEILQQLMVNENLNFIFSIGSAGKKIESSEASYTAFFKQGLHRKVSFLGEDDTHSLIVDPVKGIVDYQPKAIQRIADVTSGHPYYVQLVCHELFSDCQKTDSWKVTEKQVNALLPSIVERGTVNLKFIWDESSAMEKWIMALLAKNPGAKVAKLEEELRKEKVRFSSQDVANALLQLHERDVIRKDNSFLIHLFDLWLEENRPMEFVRQELEAEKLSDLLTKTEQMEKLERPGAALALLEEYLSLAPDKVGQQQERLQGLREKAEQAKKNSTTRNFAIAGTAIIAAIFAFIYFSGLQNPETLQDPAPSEKAAIVEDAEPTPVPTAGPTPIPLTWTRVDSAQFIQRDRVTSLQMDPEDNDILYAATLNGGVYKSINGGVSWLPTNNGINSLEILTLEIDPSNRNRIVIGSKDDVSISIDGADSWDKVGIASLINRTDTTDISISFAGDGSGDYYLGENFYLTLISNSLGYKLIYPATTIAPAVGPTCLYGPRFIKVDPLDSNVFYAIEEQDNTFSAVFTDEAGQQSLDRECEAGLYQSRDGGKLWDKKAIIEGEMLTGGRIITAKNEGISYVAISTTDHLYLTSDSGLNWKSLTDFACNPLEINSANPNNIYCYGGPDSSAEALYKTEDGGLSWARLDPQETPPSAIEISTDDSNSLFLSGSGVQKSTNGGETWFGFSSGLGAGMYELKVIDSIMYAYEYDLECQRKNSNVYSSTDVGRNWVLISDQGCGFWVDADGLIFYRIQNVNNALDSLLLSRNGGSSWQVVNSPMASIGSLGTHPTVPGIVTAIENPEDLFRINEISDTSAMFSSDFGTTWQYGDPLDSLTDFSGTTRTMFGPNLDSNAYIVDTNDRNPFVSFDSGQNWDTRFCGDFVHNLGFIDNPLTARKSPTDTALVINPQNDDILFAATRGMGVARSIDGCKTWSEANNGLENLFVTTLAINPEDPNIIYAGTDGGAYISFDGGDNWGPINDGFLGSTVVYSIVIDPTDPSIVFAATPSGIYRLEH